MEKETHIEKIERVADNDLTTIYIIEKIFVLVNNNPKLEKLEVSKLIELVSNYNDK